MFLFCLTESFKRAIRLPIIVRYNTQLKSLSGKVICSYRELRFGDVKIGFGDVGIFDKRYERCILEIAGKIVIRGNVHFGVSSKICVMQNGILEFGEKFVNSAKMTIICSKNIRFEDNVLTSWDTLVMDTDFHQTIYLDSGQLSIMEKPIHVGRNVWIGTRAVILKGSNIADGCVIGANSIVSGKLESENIVIAGNPAKIVRYNQTRLLCKEQNDI